MIIFLVIQLSVYESIGLQLDGNLKQQTKGHGLRGTVLGTALFLTAASAGREVSFLTPSPSHSRAAGSKRVKGS